MCKMGYNTGVANLKLDGRSGALTPYGLGNRNGASVTMSHSTRTPYFPANLQYYAPWVAVHGLVAPYGECQCGCGQPAPVARKTTNSKGRRKGYPVRFIRGHNARPFDSAPDGFKTCTRCGKVKPLSEFYSGGSKVASCCIACNREKCRAYHHANREKRLAQIAAYQRANKEDLRHKDRLRRMDAEYQVKKAARLKRWREKNRHHVAAYNRSVEVKARSATNRAVRSGDLPPASTMVCAICQEALAAHWHHHNGYDPEHWLDVQAVCTVCHGREHRVD